ncbi:MAG: hypothetical protein AAFZ63_25210 [Bacteroidota bacterium]
MTQEQFAKLQARTPTHTNFKVTDLHDLSDRTLLLATECKSSNKVVRHLYLEAERFHQLTYFRTVVRKPYFVNHFKDVRKLAAKQIVRENLVPQCCDLEFCHLLAGFGVKLQFQAYAVISPRQFYALRVGETSKGIYLSEKPYWL